MITKLHYSIQNGSAYPKLMESEALCELDQEHMDEGSCCGYFTIRSEGPIFVLEEVATVDSEITEAEEELSDICSYEGIISVKLSF